MQGNEIYEGEDEVERRPLLEACGAVLGALLYGEDGVPGLA